MALSAQVPYLQPPALIVNEAVLRLGEAGKIIGDITDGTPVAVAARYTYGRYLRALLRAAHWAFARQNAALTLLGDATGQTPNVSTLVEAPWTYAYAWPPDGVAARWMPSSVPLTTNGAPPPPATTQNAPAPCAANAPARFLVTSSSLYPAVTGVQNWDQLPDLQRTEGVGPIYRRVILTDIQNASFVYTRLVPVIEEWDDLFREAMVASMAVAIAPTAIEDPKLRIPAIERLKLDAKMALGDARAMSGNDQGFPQSVDYVPGWIRRRNGGWGGYNNDAYGAVPGVGGTLYSPWEPFSLGGSVY